MLINLNWQKYKETYLIVFLLPLLWYLKHMQKDKFTAVLQPLPL